MEDRRAKEEEGVADDTDNGETYLVELQPSRAVQAVAGKGDVGIQEMMRLMREVADRINGLEWSAGAMKVHDIMTRLNVVMIQRLTASPDLPTHSTSCISSSSSFWRSMRATFRRFASSPASPSPISKARRFAVGCELTD